MDSVLQQDGREILINADAVWAQDMRVTLIALTLYRLLYGEALDQWTNNVGKSGSSGKVNYSWDGEYSQAQNDSNARCGRD